jgi:hypothetical protein
MINFSGPYFEETENRLMNLHLVHHNLTHAIMYNPDGEVHFAKASKIPPSRPS